MDMVNFVRVCINIIHDNNDETFFVIIMAIDLFKAICDDNKIQNYIQYQHILNYFTEVISI